MQKLVLHYDFNEIYSNFMGWPFHFFFLNSKYSYIAGDLHMPHFSTTTEPQQNCVMLTLCNEMWNTKSVIHTFEPRWGVQETSLDQNVTKLLSQYITNKQRSISPTS